MNKKQLEKEINDSLKNANLSMNAEEILSGINGLDNYIEGEKGCTYMPIIIRADHQLTFADSYIALYGRRIANGLSTKNYLFLVTAQTEIEVISKFLAAYNELRKRKIILNREWKSSYKCFKLMLTDNKNYKMLNEF